MDKTDINEVARAITALGVWKRASKYNWALVSEMFERPWIAVVDDKVQGAAAGRLMLFNGFEAYRDFRIFQADRNVSFAMSPADIDHLEIIGCKDGSSQVLDFRPGFVPSVPDSELRNLLAPVLYECYGLLLRMEDEPELALAYKDRNALFSRREGLDGRWTDAPLAPPPDSVLSWVEKISFDKNKCARASRFDLSTEEVWETDFIPVPLYHTEEKNPRIMFLFAAVDSRTGERRVWRKLAVDPACPRDGSLNSLKALWESLSSQLLEGVLAFGKVPGAVHVNSGRMARFLRPLGLQLPFKLVHHRILPRLTAVVNRAIAERSV